MWARIYLIPALQAEEDRDQVRRYLADKAREKELLGTETKIYNSDRHAPTAPLCPCASLTRRQIRAADVRCDPRKAAKVGHESGHLQQRGLDCTYTAVLRMFQSEDGAYSARHQEMHTLSLLRIRLCMLTCAPNPRIQHRNYSEYDCEPIYDEIWRRLMVQPPRIPRDTLNPLSPSTTKSGKALLGRYWCMLRSSP